MDYRLHRIHCFCVHLLACVESNIYPMKAEYKEGPEARENFERLAKAIFAG